MTRTLTDLGTLLHVRELTGDEAVLFVRDALSSIQRRAADFNRSHNDGGSHALDLSGSTVSGSQSSYQAYTGGSDTLSLASSPSGNHAGGDGIAGLSSTGGTSVTSSHIVNIDFNSLTSTSTAAGSVPGSVGGSTATLAAPMAPGSANGNRDSTLILGIGKLIPLHCGHNGWPAPSEIEALKAAIQAAGFDIIGEGRRQAGISSGVPSAGGSSVAMATGPRGRLHSADKMATAGGGTGHSSHVSGASSHSKGSTGIIARATSPPQSSSSGPKRAAHQR